MLRVPTDSLKLQTGFGSNKTYYYHAEYNTAILLHMYKRNGQTSKTTGISKSTI